MIICGAVAGVADNIVRPLLLRNRTSSMSCCCLLACSEDSLYLACSACGRPAIVAAAMGVFRVHMMHAKIWPPRGLTNLFYHEWRTRNRVLNCKSKIRSAYVSVC